MEDLTICLSNGRADFGRYQRLFESLSVLWSPTSLLFSSASARHFPSTQVLDINELLSTTYPDVAPEAFRPNLFIAAPGYSMTFNTLA